MARTGPIVHALAIHRTVIRALPLVLLGRPGHLCRSTAGRIVRLERDVAQQNVDLVWRDHVVAIKVIPTV